MTDELSALKERDHATWAAGDYAAIAALIEEVAVRAAPRGGGPRAGPRLPA